jgi:hypothetical protein
MPMTFEAYLALAGVIVPVIIWFLDRQVHRMPRWVSLSALVFLVVALLLAAFLIVFPAGAPTTVPQSGMSADRSESGSKVDTITNRDPVTTTSNVAQPSPAGSSQSAAADQQQPNSSDRSELDAEAAPHRSPDVDAILSTRDPAHLGAVEGLGDQEFIGCAYKKAGPRDQYQQVLFGYIITAFVPEGGTVQIGKCRKFQILGSLELSAQLQTVHRGDRIEVMIWHLNP